MLIKDVNTFNDRLVNVSDHHHADLFLGIEQIEDPDIPLRDASLSHLTFPRAAFRMFHFQRSQGTISVVFSL